MSHALIKKTIKKAIERNTSLEISYFGGSSPGEKRIITPLSIINDRNKDLLIKAYCHKKGKDLHFYTSKMELPGIKNNKFSKNNARSKKRGN